MPNACLLCMTFNAHAILVTQEMDEITVISVSHGNYCNVCLLAAYLNQCFVLVPPSEIQPVAIGCSRNDDCPEYNACRNTACINPCAVDDPCAPNAICRVLSHQPVCTCPDGYIGSPETQCSLRKYA
jgi:hypothetical protein